MPQFALLTFCGHLTKLSYNSPPPTTYIEVCLMRIHYNHQTKLEFSLYCATKLLLIFFPLAEDVPEVSDGLIVPLVVSAPSFPGST